MNATPNGMCPKCGGAARPIMYGFPSPAMFGAAERGEIALGGCTLDPSNPVWECRSCGQRFEGTPPVGDG